MSSEQSEYAVGDIHSTARLSGARANRGKPRFDLLPWYQIGITMAGLQSAVELPRERSPGQQVFVDIGTYQRWRDVTYLYRAIGLCLHIMASDLDPERPMYSATLEDLAEVCKVWEINLAKYAPFNWAKGMNIMIPLGCAGRHLAAYQAGKQRDEESGCHHLALAICNLQMMIHIHEFYPEPEAWEGMPRTEWFNPPAENTPAISADSAEDEPDECSCTALAAEECELLCCDCECHSTPSARDEGARTPRVNRPDIAVCWDEVPDGIDHVAMDRGGRWYGYSEHPEFYNETQRWWSQGHVLTKRFGVQSPDDLLPKDSLVVRPGYVEGGADEQPAEDDDTPQENPTGIEVDWDDLPGEYNYAAMDISGSWYAYDSRPRCQNGSWFNETANLTSLRGRISDVPDDLQPEDSLVVRPGYVEDEE